MTFDFRPPRFMEFNPTKIAGLDCAEDESGYHFILQIWDVTTRFQCIVISHFHDFVRLCV